MSVPRKQTALLHVQSMFTHRKNSASAIQTEEMKNVTKCSVKLPVHF